MSVFQLGLNNTVNQINPNSSDFTGLYSAISLVSIETATTVALNPSTGATSQTLYTGFRPAGVQFITVTALLQWSDTATSATALPLVHPLLSVTTAANTAKTAYTMQTSTATTQGYTYSCSMSLTIPVSITETDYAITIQLFTNATTAVVGTRASNVQVIGLDILYQY